MRIPPSVDAARVEELDVGLSGARVARLFDARDRPFAVLKSVDAERPDLVAELLGQERRLRWLAGRGLPVPRVLDSGSWAGLRWLAMNHLDGRAAHEPWPAGERSRVVDLLARAARALHRVPAAGCPFDMTLPAQLERARERVASGLVERSWAAAGREGPPAAEVLSELAGLARALGPGRTALVHGDYCLPNVLLDTGSVRGGAARARRSSGGGPGPARADGWALVDLGRAGLGDPHADLADMAGSLLSPMNPQFGPPDVERFLDAYGREDVDPERLRLCAGVDSFFWPA
ncbi:aminoglycoside 3'-phosphotransferase [Nocardiopsis sp. RV163]|uniref:aminoglycoside 3'-phosphotransferase n=1 Tax=Nocardiopsis sp. RV163 TaxID=1661388 RepID=UPI00064BC0AF|nr:aminoglycoside 3'-phosphotransferase [Nocardiopsis sp. RV163]